MTRFAVPARVLRFFQCFAIVAVALAAGVLACSGASTGQGIPLETAIAVRAETLTAGRGCGPGPTQVFKYAVVVHRFNGNAAEPLWNVPLTAGIFDCFTDGAFFELPATFGDTHFELDVFVYNQAAFNGKATDVATAVGPRGFLDPASEPSKALRQTAPTWTTHCRVDQRTNVRSSAVCDPLSLGVGPSGGKIRITLPTGSFPLADGRIATCASGPEPDAGVTPDAGPDAADAAGLDSGDAGDADGAADAGLPPPGPVRFTTARIRLRTTTGGVTREPEDRPCPSLYEATVDPAPAKYALDVGLLDSTGAALGTAMCEAEIAVQPDGGTVEAVCPSPK